MTRTYKMVVTINKIIKSFRFESLNLVSFDKNNVSEVKVTITKPRSYKVLKSSFSVEALWSSHPSFGHLYRHDTVQFLHPAPHQRAEVDRRDEAVDLGDLVVVGLDPRRVETD